jgi:GH15 family glucan-1,4-alpha-glucosidase
MAAAETVDADEVRAGLRGMLEPDDPRFARLEEALHRAGTATA